MKNDWIVAPFWKIKNKIGIFPLFAQNINGSSGFFFPFYFYNSNMILTPFGGWGKKENGSSFATVLGPLYIQSETIYDKAQIGRYHIGNGVFYKDRVIQKSNTYHMFGLLGYSNSGTGLKFKDSKLQNFYAYLCGADDKSAMFSNDKKQKTQLLKLKKSGYSDVPDSVPQNKTERLELARKLEKSAEKIEWNNYGVFPLFEFENNKGNSEFVGFKLACGFLCKYFDNGRNAFEFSIVGPFGCMYKRREYGSNWRTLLFFTRSNGKFEDSFSSPFYSYSAKWKKPVFNRNTLYRGGRVEKECTQKVLFGLLYHGKTELRRKFRHYKLEQQYRNYYALLCNPFMNLSDTVSLKEDVPEHFTKLEKSTTNRFLLINWLNNYESGCSWGFLWPLAYGGREGNRENIRLLFLNSIERIGSDYDWSILWPLMRGSRQGEHEEIRILEWFYRSTKDADRENTLIFPFISIQKEKTRKSYSFLWRLFRLEYTDNKLSGGNLFFFPF